MHAGIPHSPGADTPLGADTPSGSRHPLGPDIPQSRPPRADPPEQTPPGEDTPQQSRHPLEQTPLQEQTPPEADTPPPGSRLRHTVNEWPVRILLECILVTPVCDSVHRGVSVHGWSLSGGGSVWGSLSRGHPPYGYMRTVHTLLNAFLLPMILMRNLFVITECSFQCHSSEFQWCDVSLKINFMKAISLECTISPAHDDPYSVTSTHK